MDKISLPAALFFVISVSGLAYYKPKNNRDFFTRILMIMVWSWFLNYLYIDKKMRKTAWFLFLIPYIILIILIAIFVAYYKKIEDEKNKNPL